MAQTKSLLVIDDDPHYGEMLKDALTFFGYKVFLAYSATGGLDIVKRERLDLIISDINTPSANGIQLARQLTNMFLDIPLIMVTGSNSSVDLREAMALGVSDYLFKPVNIDELPIVIEKNLERRRQESRRLRENKSDILLKALRALLRALDAKDPYTCGHSQRVVRLAMLVGNHLKLSTDQLYTLQLASFLHDIGKIGMPDKILNKADGLEDYELNIARDHPVVGSEIIGEIEELSEVASIVRHHHERYDGKGYPDQLKGEAIPYFARILSIIDCYEALVSDRVYRKGIGQSKALAEIERNAGTQFDPGLARVFVEVMRNDLNGHYPINIDHSLLVDFNSPPSASHYSS
ncbi:MAG TPA: response regulator [Calditrichia bacterium]|nr:response regulator [Calditrichota bacterium]HQU72375.1 response regulator [Calditrichia bacterium]HQV30717.1 response regulator [Calditrichia bacterium]